jgi:hypothetical protein
LDAGEALSEQAVKLQLPTTMRNYSPTLFCGEVLAGVTIADQANEWP